MRGSKVRRRLCGLLLGLLLVAVRPGAADVACDGLDDDLRSGLAISTFLSASTGTIMLWHKPTGVAENNGSGECYAGGLILASYEANVGIWLSLNRHNDYQALGLDRLTGFNWDGTSTCTAAAYTPNVWTHLAWVHGGGVLTLYKDATPQPTTASGATESLVGFLHVCGGQAATELDVEVSEGAVADVQVFPVALTEQQIRVQAQARLYRFGNTGRSGAWQLDECATTGSGVSFFDHSGNARPLTGNAGPSTTGLTCLGNTVLVYPWGVE